MSLTQRGLRQVSEYAAQREKEAADFVAAAGALEAAVAAARERVARGEASASSAQGLDGIAATLAALQAKLAESALEARAFHTQQRQDAERTKRSYSQACPAGARTVAVPELQQVAALAGRSAQRAGPWCLWARWWLRVAFRPLTHRALLLQANLRDADSADVDMKRMREHSDADTSEVRTAGPASHGCKPRALCTTGQARTRMLRARQT